MRLRTLAFATTLFIGVLLVPHGAARALDTSDYDHYRYGYDDKNDNDDWFFDWYEYDDGYYDSYYDTYVDFDDYDPGSDRFDWEETGLF